MVMYVFFSKLHYKKCGEVCNETLHVDNDKR